MKINQNTTFSKKEFPKFTLLFISIMVLIDFCIWWAVPAQRPYSLIFLTGFISLSFLIVALRTKKLKTHFEPDLEESPFLLLTAWSIFWASALNALCTLWWGGGLFIRVMAGCIGLYATWKCSWIFYYTPESTKRIKLHLPDKRYVRKKGKEEETHYFSGVFYQDKGRYREAEEEYLKVIELNPEHYKAYHNLGYVCRKTERTEEAIKYYKKALQINPQNSMSLFNLGIIYFFESAGEKGFDYFCKAIAADPTIEPHIHQFLSLYSYHTRQDIQKLHELLQRGCLEESYEIAREITDNEGG